MRIFTPDYLNAQTMYVLLGQVFDEAGQFISNQYIIDFEQTRDVDEAGFVMLDTLLLELASQKYPVTIQGGEKLPADAWRLLKLQTDSVPEGTLNEELVRDINLSGTTIAGRGGAGSKMKLYRFSVADAGLWLHKVYNNWLAHELYASSLMVAPQTQHVLELLNNVTLHAGVTRVSVATSYDGVQEELRLVLSDAGRGIPATIREVWNGSISDVVGIAKALEGGSVAGGAGIRKEGGLGRLVQEIVDQRAGNIVVTSGFGRLNCFPNAGGKVHVFEPVSAFYPGTMIEIVFSTNPIKSSAILNEPAVDVRFVLK